MFQLNADKPGVVEYETDIGDNGETCIMYLQKIVDGGDIGEKSIMYTIYMIWIILIFPNYSPTPFHKSYFGILTQNSFVRKCTKFNDFLLDILFLI